MHAVQRTLLDGVRVLDLSSFVAGPTGTMMLADWGADVIKVEPLGGEASRHLGPTHDGGLTSTTLAVNRGKRSVELDLNNQADRADFHRLVATSDVLVHNMLPGYARRVGLTEELLREHRADLVIVAISAFGLGEEADRPGLDPVFQAASGMMAVTGDAAGTPTRVGPPIIDTAAGMVAASAVLLGLLERDKTGEGMTVDLAMSEVALALQAPTLGTYLFTGEQPERLGNASLFSLTDTYPTADGSLTVSLVSDRAWSDFCTLIDAPELLVDRYGSNERRLAHRGELRAAIERGLKQRTTAEWLPALRAKRVPCSAVLGYRAAVEEVLAQNPDAVIETSDAQSTIRTPANPVRIRGHRYPTPRHAPRTGQHRDEIVAELRRTGGS